MQGSEAKDMLLGHIFGLAAVVQAGRVQDMAVRKQVATQLLLLGGKKAFVQELAVGIFLQIVGMTPSRVGQPCPCPWGASCSPGTAIGSDGGAPADWPTL